MISAGLSDACRSCARRRAPAPRRARWRQMVPRRPGSSLVSCEKESQRRRIHRGFWLSPLRPLRLCGPNSSPSRNQGRISGTLDQLPRITSKLWTVAGPPSAWVAWLKTAWRQPITRTHQYARPRRARERDWRRDRSDDEGLGRRTTHPGFGTTHPERSKRIRFGNNVIAHNFDVNANRPARGHLPARGRRGWRGSFGPRRRGERARGAAGHREQTAILIAHRGRGRAGPAQEHRTCPPAPNELAWAERVGRSARAP
jgi:hypothetical protein